MQQIEPSQNPPKPLNEEQRLGYSQMHEISPENGAVEHSCDLLHAIAEALKDDCCRTKEETFLHLQK
jgi:hypothetical protein